MTLSKEALMMDKNIFQRRAVEVLKGNTCDTESFIRYRDFRKKQKETEAGFNLSLGEAFKYQRPAHIPQDVLPNDKSLVHQY
ncbi:MAG: hypothetical protein ABIB79_02500 [archaeon]